jgi:mycothiol synthase
MDPADVSEALGTEPEWIGGRRQWWLRDAGPERHERAASLGLRPARRVLQMRVPLPLVDPPVTPLEVRPFRLGVDEDEWLAVNAAAFADHPDQGRLTRADLDQRIAAPWFDAAGFLLHDDEHGRIDGFCWTKEHRTTSPEMGEIYVIGVRPDRHGRGLGRQLTVAGLEHLADRGLEVGMLYTESDNVAAIRLYESLGFTLHHEDVAFESAHE